MRFGAVLVLKQHTNESFKPVPKIYPVLII